MKKKKKLKRGVNVINNLHVQLLALPQPEEESGMRDKIERTLLLCSMLVLTGCARASDVI